jgi:hypothetical protein
MLIALHTMATNPQYHQVRFDSETETLLDTEGKEINKNSCALEKRLPLRNYFLQRFTGVGG